MGKERLGYRRLYDSMGCNLAERQELNLAFSLKGRLSAEVYIGPRPKFGISVVHSDRYIIAGESPGLFRVEYHADATQSPYPRKFFTEIYCSFEVDVSDDLSEAFRRDDQKAKEELFASVRLRQAELRSTVDFIAGIFGLRFQRQFVIELVNENLVAIREDGPVQQFVSEAAELLERPTLNERGVHQLTELLTESGNADVELQRLAGKVLGWLIRAWAERDMLSKFVCLFIPLEMILEGYPGEPQSAKTEELKNEIEHLLSEAKRSDLVSLFKQLALDRPSLNSRFRQFAQQHQPSGWESDVRAFSQFNKMRNGLLHRGEQGVLLQVSVTEDEVRELQDLVERYVSLRFFGDTSVYQSRFRKPIKADIKA